MLFKLFLLFTITPLVELALLIKLGEVMGFMHTFSLVIFTGAVGAFLARQQGLSVIRKFQASVGKGEVPTDPLVEGLLVVVGGALLVTPGVITDFVGFSLVIPFSRKFIAGFVKKRVTENIKVNMSGPQGGFYYTNMPPGGPGQAPRRGPHDDDDVIDV